MSKRLDLVLFWHMHQPDYRDAQTGEFRLPWVYLHALKDYSDMAAHLERHPQMRAVVNFVPVLLRQLDDYCDQFATGQWRDPLLRALAANSGETLCASDRAQVLDLCFRANARTMIEPFAGYARLAELHRRCTADGVDVSHYLSGTYLTDLATWYHLAWTGETLRQDEPLLRRLFARGNSFDASERQSLLALVGREVARVVPRWRALAERGQVELSSTPDCHPLAPLMIDFAAARATQPQCSLPRARRYPGGAARVSAHVERAFAEHAHRFGAAPRGIWPAEGAVSAPVCALLEQHGSRWAATGEGVLMNSLHAAGLAPGPQMRECMLYRPYVLAPAGTSPDASALRLFFRDDRLSDLIGFDYARRHSGEAAAQFVAELESIAAGWEQPAVPVVSVMLDGENAWEHFPYNGYYFLDELYRRLAAHPVIRPTTFAAVLESGAPAAPLPALTPGSWVYGDLATWLGAPEKNRAWDLLAAAKSAYDGVIDTLSPAARAEAERRLSVCEGSDWFWWFGDYNPEQTIASFDLLFRTHLSRLYDSLGLPVPAELAERIHAANVGGEAEGGGSMRRGSAAGG